MANSDHLFNQLDTLLLSTLLHSNEPLIYVLHSPLTWCRVVILFYPAIKTSSRFEKKKKKKKIEPVFFRVSLSFLSFFKIIKYTHGKPVCSFTRTRSRKWSLQRRWRSKYQFLILSPACILNNPI